MTTPAPAEKRNVLLLATAQALFQTAGVLVMTLSGLVGLQLAPEPGLATLPIALMMVASALATIPASLFMQRHGRRAGFLVGTALGAGAGLLAAGAIALSHFWLFVAANMLMGAYQGVAQFYRFAAADAASAAFRSRAISWVVAGGVVAAVAGPTLARLTQHVGSLSFLASYLSLVLLGALAAVVVSRLSLLSPQAEAAQGPARPLAAILRQPVFITAVLGSLTGAGVMIMVMTATPLAMHVAIALSGTAFLHFLSGLVLLGVGWNFLFVGGSTLLTDAHTPAEKCKTQAAHDFLVLAVVSIASFSAGKLLAVWGWQSVNLTALPLLGLSLLVLLWFARLRRRAALLVAA